MKIENLSDRDQKALEMIRSGEVKYQSQLWKNLDISSRTGTRVAKSLESKDFIERYETTKDGYITYELRPVHKPEELDFSLLMADNMISPFIGNDEMDSQSEEFSMWIMNLA